MMKVLVCGGRDYDDLLKIYDTLDAIVDQNEDHIFIIHGNATGADSHADGWAMSRGNPCARVPANWNKYSKSAGPRRNGWMLELRPDLVVAFPGGNGTKNMIEQAEKAGIPVKVVS